ncbi:tetratricopeptide repeat protein [Pendulispora brunnea]|uniref:Tetratricopeptide repeat protein n=1 Tax=Pendulispora brunnea TaxID=2905690 RepID=A0ABZ2KPU2_9BACT
MDDSVGRRSPRSLSPERRASALPRSDHTHDPAGEEFLFHLFRGSELLQDSRVHEAKEELEQALLLQPRDPKGQDLLAVVYFRIGHYPRAIQIYEQLKRDHPGRASLSLNLALCYLKTGQAQLAREELEEVVRLSPEHRRAWGYLGLAYERLGDYDKAELAFERGGHSAMARRMMQRRGGRPSIAALSSELGYSMRPSDPTRDSYEPPRRYSENGKPPSLGAVETPTPAGATPAPHSEALEDVRAAAAEAFEELDAGELSFVLAQAETRRPDGEMWHPVEIGEAIRFPAHMPGPSSLPIPASAPAPSPRSVPQILAAARIAASVDRSIAAARNAGHVVVSLAKRENEETAHAFAVRFDALRSYTGTLAASVLERRGRGACDAFGGISATVMQVTGDGLLVLAPRAGRSALASTLGEDDVLFLREDAILAFDLTMPFENGKILQDPIFVAQLKGPGPVAFEYIEPLTTLEVTPSHPATVRSPSVLGWMGRLVPESIAPGEAPGGVRGLISFAGTGTVLVAGR